MAIVLLSISHLQVIKELYKCFENKNNYVGMVESNVSGPLDCSFCNIINHYMPTKLAGNRASNFEVHPLNNKTEGLMRIREKNISSLMNCLFILINFAERYRIYILI